MAILSWREMVGRTYTEGFLENPQAERRFVLTLDGPQVGSGEALAAIGATLLSDHPEYPFLKLTSVSVNEGSPTPFHAEVSLSYTVPEDDGTNPLTRPAQWSFTVGGTQVAARYYYDGNVRKSLVNAAGDIFEGLQTDEAEVKAQIQVNKAAFPLGLAVSATNRLNSDAYLGAPPHYWKCAGISASMAEETVNKQTIKYWAVSIELIYRASGWPLQIPQTGYNCIENGVKIRGYVFDPEDLKTGIETRIASSSPIALNADGTIRMNTADNPPDIITRRVHDVVAFQPLFGTPPA